MPGIDHVAANRSFQLLKVALLGGLFGFVHFPIMWRLRKHTVYKEKKGYPRTPLIPSFAAYKEMRSKYNVFEGSTSDEIKEIHEKAKNVPKLHLIPSYLEHEQQEKVIRFADGSHEDIEIPEYK